MVDSVQVFDPNFRVLDSNGDPVSGAKIYFYDAGTTDDQTTYSDDDLMTALPNPIICDSGGRPTSDGNSLVNVYVGTAAYKCTITDSDDVQLYLVDNQKGAIDTSSFSSGSGSFSTPVNAETSDFVIDSNYYGDLTSCDPTGGNFTATLPSAVTATNGTRIGLRHDGSANQVLIATVSNQSIKLPGGATTAGMALTGKGHTAWLVSDGADWTLDIEVGPIGNSTRILIADRLTSPPASPTPGARYIINGTPELAWASFSENDIVEADGQGSWTQYTPTADCGWLAYIQDEDLNTQYQSSGWVDHSNVGAPDQVAKPIAIFTREKTSGTVGGTATITTWTALTDFADTIANTITGASLSSGQVTLPAGTWRIRAVHFFLQCYGTQMRFQSTTTSKVIYSTQHFTGLYATSPQVGLSGQVELEGRLTLTEEETFELQYFASNVTSSTSNLGSPKSLSGADEVYGQIVIEDDLTNQGPQGAQGAQGAAGAAGTDAGYQYTWSSDTSETDPSSGGVKVDNGTLASATEVYISETDADANDLAAEIATWDDSTSSTRAKIKIEGTAGMILFDVDGANVDNGSWVTLQGSVIASRGSLSGTVRVLPVVTGDAGAAGAAGATGSTGASAPLLLDMTWNTATSGDPGSGAIRVDNGTLASLTEFAISETDRLGTDIAALIASFDDSSSTTSKATFKIIDASDATNWIALRITSTLTDAGTYDTFVAEYVDHSGTIANSATVAVIFVPTGDAGSGLANVVDDTTPQLGGTLDANGNQIRLAKGSDIASATTITIPTNGNFFDVTGTTTITGINTVAVGTEVVLQFDGALQLTDGASFILPGGNITTAAEDVGIFTEVSSGVWQCISWQPVAGYQAAGNYEPVDAEILRADTDDNLTAGYTSTADDDGTKSSGTYTPTPAGGNFKRIVNGGAFTLAAPTATGDYDIVIQVTNNGSAGTVTLSGFTLESGGTLTTTNGDDFFLNIRKVNGFTRINIEALQ